MASKDAGKPEKRRSKKGDGTLGERLRSLRNEKGITGDELARRLGTSQATVSKMETGFQKPTMDYIVRFAGAVGLAKAETSDLLMRLNLLPSGKGRGKAVSLSLDLGAGEELQRQRKAVEEVESRASVIRVFDSGGVSDILQTEEYARTASRLSGTTEHGAVETLVRTRIRRQRDLGKTKQLLVVLTEGALRARISASLEMVTQVERIKSFAQAQGSHLGVIGWHTRLVVTIPPPFRIYDNTLAYLELPHGLVCLTRQKDIELYLQLFETLERAAVTGSEAGSILDRIIQDFRRLEELERALNVAPV
jgi:transcriptional regulator with XRE-family HTH domain